MRGDEDAADVARVLAGDPSAYEGIVRRWQGPLVNLAYRFCRDRGRAEEMAQDAFLQAYRSLDRWRGDAMFSTWLFALTTNLLRSQMRRLPPRTVPLDANQEIVDPRSMGRDLEEEDRDKAVRRLVASLPGKYRDAMLLFYFHEMDVTEAARTLGLPEGTMKARLHRGREILHRRLASVLSPRPSPKEA